MDDENESVDLNGGASSTGLYISDRGEHVSLFDEGNGNGTGSAAMEAGGWAWRPGIGSKR